MATGPKKIRGGGFCHGNTMAVGKTRFLSRWVFAMAIPWQRDRKKLESKVFAMVTPWQRAKPGFEVFAMVIPWQMDPRQPKSTNWLAP